MEVRTMPSTPDAQALQERFLELAREPQDLPSWLDDPAALEEVRQTVRDVLAAIDEAVPMIDPAVRAVILVEAISMGVAVYAEVRPRGNMRIPEIADRDQIRAFWLAVQAVGNGAREALAPFFGDSGRFDPLAFVTASVAVLPELHGDEPERAIPALQERNTPAWAGLSAGVAVIRPKTCENLLCEIKTAFRFTHFEGLTEQEQAAAIEDLTQTEDITALSYVDRAGHLRLGWNQIVEMLRRRGLALAESQKKIHSEEHYEDFDRVAWTGLGPVDTAEHREFREVLFLEATDEKDRENTRMRLEEKPLSLRARAKALGMSHVALAKREAKHFARVKRHYPS
jgi:hypothetical protein